MSALLKENSLAIYMTCLIRFSQERVLIALSSAFMVLRGYFYTIGTTFFSLLKLAPMSFTAERRLLLLVFSQK